MALTQLNSVINNNFVVTFIEEKKPAWTELIIVVSFIFHFLAILYLSCWLASPGHISLPSACKRIPEIQHCFILQGFYALFCLFMFCFFQIVDL